MESDSTIDRVFVYGSLRPEFANPMSRWLSSLSTCLGVGWIGGELYDLGDYPGLVLVEEAGAARVTGAVLQLNPGECGRVLARLDEYEQVQSGAADTGEYTRRQVEIFMEDTSWLQVWVFVYNRSVHGLKRIESGDYIQYCIDHDPARFTWTDRLVPPDEGSS